MKETKNKIYKNNKNNKNDGSSFDNLLCTEEQMYDNVGAEEMDREMYTGLNNQIEANEKQILGLEVKYNL